MYEEKACEIPTRSLFLLDKGITIQKLSDDYQKNQKTKINALERPYP